MSGKIMGKVLDSALPWKETYVLVAMADHADESGQGIYPSIATIKRRTKLAESTIHIAISELRKSGVLKEIRESWNWRGTEYAIDIDALPENKALNTLGVQVADPPPPPGGPPGVQVVDPESSLESLIESPNSIPPTPRRMTRKEKDLLDLNQDVVYWMWKVAQDAGKRWKSSGQEKKSPTTKMESAIRYRESLERVEFRRAWLRFLKGEDRAKYPYSDFLGMGFESQPTQAGPRNKNNGQVKLSDTAKLCYDYAVEGFREVKGRLPRSWDKYDAEAVQELVAKGTTPDEFKAAWQNFAQSSDPFDLKQGLRLRYLCRHYDRFDGKQISRAEQRRLAGEKALERVLAKRSAHR